MDNTIKLASIDNLPRESKILANEAYGKAVEEKGDVIGNISKSTQEAQEVANTLQKNIKEYGKYNRTPEINRGNNLRQNEDDREI